MLSISYPFNCLHFLLISVLPIRSTNSSIGFRVTILILISRCGAVCLEESEGSKVVSSAGLVLVENGLVIEAG